MGQNGQFGEGREGHHAIGHVNFSKLLEQKVPGLPMEGRDGVSPAASNLHIHKDVYDFRMGKCAPVLTLSPEFATFWA